MPRGATPGVLSAAEAALRTLLEAGPQSPQVLTATLYNEQGEEFREAVRTLWLLSVHCLENDTSHSARRSSKLVAL